MKALAVGDVAMVGMLAIRPGMKRRATAAPRHMPIKLSANAPMPARKPRAACVSRTAATMMSRSTPLECPLTQAGLHPQARPARISCSCQSSGTRSAGPGVVCSAGWLCGGASRGPANMRSAAKSQNQPSPGSKDCMIR